MTSTDKITWRKLSADLSHAQDDVAAAMVRLTRMPRPQPDSIEAMLTLDALDATLARVDRAQQRMTTFLRSSPT